MPILDDSLEQINVPNSHFGFSATPIENLGAIEYTLATVVVDVSGSTDGFRPEMETVLKTVVKSLRKSPRADYLMFRTVLFGSRVEELHGFKLLENVNEDDYTGVLASPGLGERTALYEATYNGAASIVEYAKQLRGSDFDANAILIVITDGEENASSTTLKQVKKEFDEATASESLESLMTILVGINTNFSAQQALADYSKDATFDQYVEAGDADEQNLVRLAGFVSRSISSQSNSLGSGSKSASLVF